MTPTGNTCPGCGYSGLDEPAYLPSGGGSFEICDSCGFEYGYTDDDQGFSFEEWRKRWIDAGMPWRAQGIVDPPDGWDPRAQLKSLGDSG